MRHGTTELGLRSALPLMPPMMGWSRMTAFASRTRFLPPWWGASKQSGVLCCFNPRTQLDVRFPRRLRSTPRRLPVRLVDARCFAIGTESPRDDPNQVAACFCEATVAASYHSRAMGIHWQGQTLSDSQSVVHRPFHQRSRTTSAPSDAGTMECSKRLATGASSSAISLRRHSGGVDKVDGRG